MFRFRSDKRHAQPQQARAATLKAYELRDRMTEPERLFATFLYERQVTGDLEKALTAVQAWFQRYPNDATAAGLTSGFSSMGTARFELAMEAARRSSQLNPKVIYPYVTRAHAFNELESLRRSRSSCSAGGGARVAMTFQVSLSCATVWRSWKGRSPHNATRVGEEPRQKRMGGLAYPHGRISRSFAGAIEKRLASERMRRASDLAAQSGRSERAATFAAAVAYVNALFDRPAEVKLGLDHARRQARSGRDLRNSL